MKYYCNNYEKNKQEHPCLKQCKNCEKIQPEMKRTNQVRDFSNPDKIEQIYIDGVHEYNYLVVELERDYSKSHSLHYSGHENWSQQIGETLAMEIVDNGNGITVMDYDLNNHINYLDTEKLHILLRLMSDQCKYELAEPSVKVEF